MILWLNPIVGISGDMLLGALLDAGAPLADVRGAIAATGLTGWTITPTQVQRGGLRGTHARVTVDPHPAHRRPSVLEELIQATPEPAVAEMALRALAALVTVEARIHSVPAEDVHLHELGSDDTVVDLVGVAAALHALGVDEVFSAPIGVGTGTARTDHGTIPVPAPATSALLAGMRIVGSPGDGETVTPTGAALLQASAVSFDPLPAMTLTATGFGAGSRDPAGYPNLLPVMLGRRSGADDGAERIDRQVEVETLIDDLSGEVLAGLVARLLAAGALDAWLAPVLGKKGRPAHVVTALCPPERVDAVQARLLADTGSLGVRRHEVTRHALPRQIVTVQVAGRPVRIKVGPHRAKPEHDDVAAIARHADLPIAEVTERAVAVYRARTKLD